MFIEKKSVFITFLLLVLTFGELLNHEKSPTLLVLCTKDFIRINVLISYYNFFGVVYTRPDRNTCSVQGLGEQEITLFVPLLEPGRSDCGVALQDDFYTVVIDIRKHNIIELVSDTSFLVQCSASETTKLKPSPKTQMALQILENDEPVRETVVGKSYTVQLEVPNNYFYEVSSCVAFSGDNTIKFVPLMDSSGCPIEDLITPFIPVFGTKMIRAEMRMFKFNDSTSFHIQCTVSKCEGRCVKTICGSGNGANRLFSPRILAQNGEEAFAAFRVSVLEQSQTSTSIQYIGCNYSEEPSLYGLIILLLLLMFLTFILCSLAVYNRPFKCLIQERDRSSVHEELIQIVDEPQDNWPPFLSPFKFLFQLALPSTPLLVINTVPPTEENDNDELEKDTRDSVSENPDGPIVQLAESLDTENAGSTLRSRREAPTVVLSGNSSVTGSISGRSTQISIRSDTNTNDTLDRKPPTLTTFRPGPTPPPRIDSINPSLTSAIQLSPPLPPPPNGIPTEISDDSSEEELFPPPPCFTMSGGNPIQRLSAKNFALWECPSSSTMPTYAVPMKGKSGRLRNLTSKTDQIPETNKKPAEKFSDSLEDDTKNIHSLLNSFRQKRERTFSRNLKAAFGDLKPQSDKDSEAWPYD